MRTYRGYIIERAGLNASGIRWECLTEKGRLRSDTLEGLKQMIRDSLEGGF